MLTSLLSLNTSSENKLSYPTLTILIIKRRYLTHQIIIAFRVLKKILILNRKVIFLANKKIFNNFIILFPN